MDDEAVRLAARPGPIGIIKTAGIDGRYSTDAFGNAARRIAFFIHIFRRCYLQAMGIRDFQQEALKPTGINIFQGKCRIRAGLEIKQFLLRRRTDTA